MDKPQIGHWYPLTAPGYVCASGQPYHGGLRLGTENNLIVYLDGGGLSWNKETAAMSLSGAQGDSTAAYFDIVGNIADMDYRSGVCSREDWNPFRNWTVVVVCYATGDLHVGNCELPYNDLKGEEKILYHHGYRNFHMVMEQAMKYIDMPQKLLIAGGSAGAAGAAALAGEVADMFPRCEDVTCLVDGVLLLTDWKPIVRNLWNAPEKFWNVIRSDNVAADWMYAVEQEKQKRVKWLFVCSIRDAVLAVYQDALEGREYCYSKESGRKFEEKLKQMCARLLKEIPEIGIYIYDYPEGGVAAELELTQHTISLSEVMREKLEDNVSPLEWVWNAVGGNVKCHGLDHVKVDKD